MAADLDAVAADLDAIAAGIITTITGTTMATVGMVGDIEATVTKPISEMIWT